jgi:hypothetical protein
MLKQETIGAAVAPAAPARSRDRFVPWLVGAIVLLLVVVIALGAMLAAPLATTSPTTDLINRNIAAWNDFDADTIRSIYADDAFMFASSELTPVASGIDEIVSLAQWGGYSIERLGPLTERGSMVWYPIHVSTTYDVAGDDALSVVLVRDGKIAQHWVIWAH